MLVTSQGSPSLTNEFWRCIDQIDDADRIDGRMATALSGELARLPIPRIVGFHLQLLEHSRQLLTWELWEAAEIIHGGSCSEDTFCYFRLWVISRGESVFRTAVADPDGLAEEPRIARLAGKPPSVWTNDDFPHMEDLLITAEMAYDRAVMKLRPGLAESLPFPTELHDRPRETPNSSMPRDLGGRERARRTCPRLSALFGERND